MGRDGQQPKGTLLLHHDGRTPPALDGEGGVGSDGLHHSSARGRTGITRSEAMAAFREWILRLWGTLRPWRVDRDLESELRIHVEIATEDARRAAQSPEDLRAAVIESRSIAQAMEALRDQRGLPRLDD